MSYKPKKSDIPFITNRIGVNENRIQKIKDIIESKKRDIKIIESEINADKNLLKEITNQH